MPRRPRHNSELEGDVRVLLERLTKFGPDGPAMGEQLAIVQALRTRTPDASTATDQWLLGEIQDLREGLFEAREHHTHLKGVLEKLSGTPWHPAVFMGPVAAEAKATAMVAVNGSMRVVSLADGVALEDLSVGDDVLLNRDLAAVVCKSGTALTRACETATFQHRLGDGRLLLRHRDADVVVRSAAGLDTAGLGSGDRVRWDPAIGLAFEKIERTRDSEFFLEDAPSEGFEGIGGLDLQIEQIQQTLGLHILHPEVVSRYHLKRTASVLLVGPPGTGKTMIARALAHWLGARSRSSRARFMNVKPGALSSMWFGESERQYRELFRIAREAGEAEPDVPVVMFFDEVDAIGATRGGSIMRVDDKVLDSFMAELDGLTSRGNILVVAATNRRDALDPGLLRPGRLGDLILEIPRPGVSAANAILATHLPASMPYEGDDPAASRRAIIDAAVSRLYAPNGEGDIASITFRDGTQRPIRARDVVSGASLANITRRATEAACAREVKHHQAGLRVTDVLDAITDELDRAVGSLSPANCHAFISGLPQDLAVARVEPVIKKVRRPHAFITAA